MGEPRFPEPEKRVGLGESTLAMLPYRASSHHCFSGPARTLKSRMTPHDRPLFDKRRNLIEDSSCAVLIVHKPVKREREREKSMT